MADEKLDLPDGLNWETLKAAVEIIDEWELDGSDSNVALAISLFQLFSLAQQPQTEKQQHEAAADDGRHDLDRSNFVGS
jgi:hypothetical protein